MNEENKKNKNNEGAESIDDILRSFQGKSKKDDVSEEPDKRDDDFSMPAPPERSERQAKEHPWQDGDKAKKLKSRKQKKDKPDSDKKKLDIKSLISKIKELPDLPYKLKGKLSKRTILIVVSVLVIIVVLAGVVFGIAGGVSKSNASYLKPYQKKYSTVTFPDGIQEKYCDMFGQHPNSTGYLKLDEIGYDGVVLNEDNKKRLPYSESNQKDCFQNNYVIYLYDNKLEEYYKDADSYNKKASGFITYSDFVYDYNFKVIGAFYTNTKPEDDNGYIFPYNVTEKLSEKSTPQFTDRLMTRFLYDTEVDITREDKLITISCPTDFRKDFRFVVVGVMRDKDDEKPVAKEKSRVHYPQVVYDELGEKNPYRLAAKWYPEVIIMSSSEETKTSKQTIDEYRQK